MILFCKITVISIYLLGSFNFGESAKILAIFPTPSISHQVVFRPITQELARRGHEVTVVTTDPVFDKGKTPPNLTEIDVHDVSYKLWNEYWMIHASDIKSVVKQIDIFFGVIVPIIEAQIKAAEFDKLLKERPHFDLILLEAWVRPILVFSHIFKAPVIQISSMAAVWHNYENVGAPTHTMLFPRNVRQRLYNLTIVEKITELYHDYLFNNLVDNFEVKYNAWLKNTFGDDTPSLEVLSDNINMLFLNIHPLWSENQPVPPNVVHIWGIHQRPKKTLPKDLQTFLDSSKQGVIYMSFGTNTQPSTLPPEKIQMFIKVFSSLPYKVLWKWDTDELPGRPDNVRTSTWFPQSDLLRHPNVKLFITQGGLQSTDEAITAGVPLVGIPLLGDQWYNTEKYLHHGIGVKLDFDTLIEGELKNAIEKVIGDDSYRNNIIRLRSIMQDEPQPAIERAIWSIEYVLRHPDPRHLRSPLANIKWREYYEVDLILFILGAFVLILSLLYFLLKLILKTFSNKRKID